MPTSRNALRRRQSSSSRPTRRRLLLESLEDRSLMALVSYWSGDNTALDPISGNNGTLYNGATYAAGQVSQAFSFDGVNDRINVADSPSLALTHSMSIEAWVKVNAISPTNGGVILMRADDRGGLDPYILSVDPNGTLKFGITPITNQGVSISAPIGVGQFIHVAATLDDATGAMKLYENGALMTETVTTVRPFANLDPASNPAVGIGNHGGYPTTPHNFPFNGLIDDLKLYDHPLTADEILADFNSQKGSLTPTIAIGDAVATEGDVHFAVNLGPFVTTADNGGLMRSSGMAFGPDGNLYVGSFNTNEVLRYDGVTGAFMGAFVMAGSGGLNTPAADSLIFRPDGKLYVASRDNASVLRYDAATGAFLDTFIASGSGGLSGIKGMTFGPDGNLYISSADNSQILRYSGATGAYLGAFVTAGSGGLSGPRCVKFGPDGNLYVASSNTNAVLRYNGATGAFLNAFVPAGSGGLIATGGLLFQGGSLYVASQGTNEVLRYSATTGAFQDVVEPGSVGSMDRPIPLILDPSGNLLVGDNLSVIRYGKASQASFTVSLSAPWPSPISVSFATDNGTAIAGSDYLASSGTINFAPGQFAQTVGVLTSDDMAFEGNETFTVNLSNPAGATIADFTGIGTIIDNDLPPTKFYVVNDGSPDRTYEYGASGTSVENYAIASGNTAPRGAASTAAGNYVWVVDANRNVYVYSPSGSPAGSWSVSGFNASAQFEGIATNGTDIWIVDAKSDKVYKFAGAASRLSGIQSAVSSFSLNSSNADATDLVTDGTSIWVVNNTSSTDKVFKYTALDNIPVVGKPAGTLLGSWTISSGGGSPTGITIDPSNATQDIWIVDSTSDKVYQFNNARGVTSGSVNASLLFSLSSTNTNPQGIADPPAPSVGGLTAPLSSSSTDSSFDSALLSVVGELDDLLMGGKKRK